MLSIAVIAAFVTGFTTTAFVAGPAIAQAIANRRSEKAERLALVYPYRVEAWRNRAIVDHLNNR